MAVDLAARLQGLARGYTHALKASLGERLVSVVLFGSTARGEATPSSDIDLLIIAEDLPRGRFARVNLLEPSRSQVEPQRQELLDQGIYTDFTEVILAPEEAQHPRLLYLDMTREAVILYDKEGFFNGVLEKLRRRLRELGARREPLGKGWYWVLKPDLKPGEEVEL